MLFYSLHEIMLPDILLIVGLAVIQTLRWQFMQSGMVSLT